MTPGRSRFGLLVTLAGVSSAPSILVREPVQWLDRAILAAVVAHRRPTWKEPAARLTALAEPPAVILALTATGVWGLVRGVPARTVLRVLTVAAGGIALRRILAEAVQRTRPPSDGWWAIPSGFSFPSRHVSWAALGYGAAADILKAGGRPVSVLTTIAPTALVAATRLLLAVHWPSDVAAAAAFAVAWRRLTR